jgi:hypothetical protein
VRGVTDPEAEKPERSPEPPEPEFESTMDKLNRGALPPDDPLVQLRGAIEGLRSLIKS